MGLLKSLRVHKLRLRKKPKNPNRVFPNSKQIIEYAFTVGNRDYFRYDDVFALPYERGLMAIAAYHELNMRCTRDYLLQHCEVIDKVLHSGNKIDVFAINELNKQMKERLNLVTDVDLMYKLASVVFFDENENPALYEVEYNRKKIDFWKKSAGVNTFFLQKPLMELIPFLKSVEIDLDMYSQLNDELNEIHRQKLRVLANEPEPKSKT